MSRLTKHAWLAVLMVFAMGLAACGGDDSPCDADICIALVAPSASNDLAFTQSMVDSLNRIASERDVEIDVTDGTFVIEDAALAIRGYAEDGYDIVIAHGSQYGGSLQEIAPDFPDTAFAWGTTRDTFGLPNVYAYTVQSDEGAYVMGTLAARLTQSKVIGVVGPIEVGDAKLYVDGFVAGVNNEDPSVVVNVNYIDSFSDVALAAEAAQAHLQAGADIMTGTAQMVVGATGVARENDVLWFGTQSEQTTLGESIVVASQVYHWEPALRIILDNYDDGVLGGQVLVASFADGGLEMAYNSGVSISAEDRARADEIEEGLRNGTLSTGVGG
jgi:basic membrane lipoprotein Med (substrate-binding protein (PBP1-ABC) superfamily)